MKQEVIDEPAACEALINIHQEVDFHDCRKANE
jgi:hypothetical protein